MNPIGAKEVEFQRNPQQISGDIIMAQARLPFATPEDVLHVIQIDSRQALSKENLRYLDDVVVIDYKDPNLVCQLLKEVKKVQELLRQNLSVHEMFIQHAGMYYRAPEGMPQAWVDVLKKTPTPQQFASKVIEENHNDLSIFRDKEAEIRQLAANK